MLYTKVNLFWNKYRIFLNINQFGNEKEASVSVERESGSNTGNLGSGDRFNVKASESQFFEFGVLFIKGGEAKLEFFMPTPRYRLEVGLVKLEGMFVGHSGGAVVLAALEELKKVDMASIVCVIPDGGYRYLSGGVWW